MPVKVFDVLARNGQYVVACRLPEREARRKAKWFNDLARDTGREPSAIVVEPADPDRLILEIREGSSIISLELEGVDPLLTRRWVDNVRASNSATIRICPA